MGYTVAEKIIKSHLVKGELTRGGEIGIRIDQTLTQDSTGTMAYLQFEAMGIDRVKTKRSLAYIDHNTIQSGPENADDHYYIQTVAKKHGIYFSKPGNGICHQVQLERFAVPGETLLGSDSHSPTAGGMGMLAMGAGGLDVAVAMGGGEYYLTMPRIVKVNLVGKLRPGVSAKDVILEVLRNYTVKGGVGKIFEYCGEGVKSLTVPERATITNMGAELGATTSVFPSDQETLKFLKAQDRAVDYTEITADDDALYDEELTIDLSLLEPLVALPHSPDKVVPVSSLGDVKVSQVAIGSCTNSSYMDLMKVASILEGKTVSEDVSLVIAPGSKQVLNMLAENGALGKLVASGARILESACGPCIGMGQAPRNKGVSVRTFNRNFQGRSGTVSADVYLASPEVAAISAITGYLTYDESHVRGLAVEMPQSFLINDNLVVPPAEQPNNVEVVRGPNIKPFPKAEPIGPVVGGKTLIKLGDNITTDHIMPSNASLLPYRSNIPYLSKFCLAPCDEKFSERAESLQGGFIVGGSNYGQGSSREHAALVPLYLGVKAVITKSFARIHKQNLVNNGIIPLCFVDTKDYDDIQMMDELIIEDTKKQLEKDFLVVKNTTRNKEYITKPELSRRQKDILLAGGLLNFVK